MLMLLSKCNGRLDDENAFSQLHLEEHLPVMMTNPLNINFRIEFKRISKHAIK